MQFSRKAQEQLPYISHYIPILSLYLYIFVLRITLESLTMASSCLLDSGARCESGSQMVRWCHEVLYEAILLLNRVSTIFNWFNCHQFLYWNCYLGVYCYLWPFFGFVLAATQAASKARGTVELWASSCKASATLLEPNRQNNSKSLTTPCWDAKA